ncbi:hypothetical protein GCM10010174_67910 [Kutzneria viridogrisea]
MDGSTVDAEATGYLLDGASAGWQQKLDESPDPIQGRRFFWESEGVEELSGIGAQLWVRRLVRCIEIGLVENDPVEFSLERECGAEKLSMGARVRRCRVCEADGERLPPGAEEVAQQPVECAHRELARLPGFRGFAEFETNAHGCQPVCD